MSEVLPAITETGCCQRFDPAPYLGTEHVWHDKPFVKTHVTSLFHVPLDMGRKVTKSMALIEAAHAAHEHPMMLSDELSPWGSDLYIEVDANVPGAQMAALSGRFLTRVFDGPFADMGRWTEETKAWVEGRGERLERLFFAYTTCPACAKAYGHNYVVAFARVAGDRNPLEEET